MDRERLQEFEARGKRLATRRKVTGYCLFGLSVVAGGCLSVLLFLVPFVVDPAVTALLADYAYGATCEVTSAVYGVGLSRCEWTSCVEGCTKILYRCFQIKVKVSGVESTSEPTSATSFTGEDVVEASNNRSTPYGELAPDERVLLVNARGCGYPPKVRCEAFYSEFGQPGLTFPCYYSRTNSALALAQYDGQAVIRSLWFSSGPLILMLVSSIGILVAVHCLRRIDREVKEREDEEDLGDFEDDEDEPVSSLDSAAAAAAVTSAIPPVPAGANSPAAFRGSSFELSHDGLKSKRPPWEDEEEEDGDGFGAFGLSKRKLAAESAAPTLDKRIRR